MTQRTAAKPAGGPALWLMLAAVGAALLAAALLGSWRSQGAPFCGPGCIDARLAALTAADGSLPARAYNPARALVRRQLGYSPFDPAGWLRLAALETAAGGGRLTPQARLALERSYRFTPVDIRVARWRLRFAFDHWIELDPGLRKSAETELRSLCAATSNLEVLRSLSGEVSAPAGRLALSLLLDQIGGR